MSAGADDRSSRRSAIADATEAVRAAHPESDRQAVTMLREELHIHGVVDISDDAIAKAAPLCRKPRVVAGLLAAKIALGTFWRLGRDLGRLAEPDWLTPPPDVVGLEPGQGQTTRAADVALDPAAAGLLARIEAERPLDEDGRVPFSAWFDSEAESSPIRVMAGQTQIGHITDDDAAAARLSLKKAGTPLWTIGLLYPSAAAGGPPLMRIGIADSDT